MPNYRDEAVVLRTHKLGEVDRILTLLTRQHGQIRAVAKGIRKTTSRFGGRLEPFTVVDVQLYEGKNLDTVTQAEQLASYGTNIIEDYQRYTIGSAIVEAAERLTREVSSEKHYLLVVGALRSLAQTEIEPDQILDSYLLRALSLSGWVPTLTECVSCGREPTSFSVQTGAVTCQSCSIPGSIVLGRPGITHMTNLLSGNWEEVAKVSDSVRKGVSGSIAGYTQWQLERGLRSMNFVERS